MLNLELTDCKAYRLRKWLSEYADILRDAGASMQLGNPTADELKRSKQTLKDSKEVRNFIENRLDTRLWKYRRKKWN